MSGTGAPGTPDSSTSVNRRRQQKRPRPTSWSEGVLTRANEIEALTVLLAKRAQRADPQQAETTTTLADAIKLHLEAGREAATSRPRFFARVLRDSALRQRAISNLDAAEALLLQLAPPEYVFNQLPSVLNDVQRHLLPTDPTRMKVEQIARTLDVNGPDHVRASGSGSVADAIKEEIEWNRGTLANATTVARSAGLREERRVDSFYLVVVMASVAMTVLAIGVAVVGFVRPAWLPLCFQPEDSGETVIVCPTSQSAPLPAPQASEAASDALETTASSVDVLVVELVGLIAAALAAAGAIRNMQGMSAPYGLPVSLAVLKLPTGAITAFLGLLLMRGEFIPGLAALDSPAQILAWAVIFGYAQQVVTHFVDVQARAVVESVSGRK